MSHYELRVGACAACISKVTVATVLPYTRIPAQPSVQKVYAVTEPKFCNTSLRDVPDSSSIESEISIYIVRWPAGIRECRVRLRSRIPFCDVKIS
jgi:hypothetical protein